MVQYKDPNIRLDCISGDVYCFVDNSEYGAAKESTSVKEEKA